MVNIPANFESMSEAARWAFVKTVKARLVVEYPTSSDVGHNLSYALSEIREAPPAEQRQILEQIIRDYNV